MLEVLSRGDAYFSFEFLDEVEVIVEAHCFADLVKGEPGGFQQLFGLIHPQFRNVLGIGQAGFVFDQLADVRGIQVKLL